MEQSLQPVIKAAMVKDQGEIREALAALLSGTEGYRCPGSFRSIVARSGEPGH